MENFIKNYDDPVQVIDVRDIPSLIDTNATINNELTGYDMTSLGTLMLLGQATSGNAKNNKEDNEDSNLQRISLAYEKLRTMPKILVEEIAVNVKILDISNNEFQNLEFLHAFKHLTTLICDKNNITSDTMFPFLPKLELLWLNHCKIKELYPWAKKLRHSCPNLRYLSLMGNEIAPSYLNGGSFYEYLQYRYFIVSLFPKLVHLDDRPVTSSQRLEAEKMYNRPLVERLVSRTQNNLPAYLRFMTEKVTEMLAPAPTPHHHHGGRQKNLIV